MLKENMVNTTSTETVKTETIPSDVLFAFSEAAAAFEQDVPAANQQDTLEDSKQTTIRNNNQSELKSEESLVTKRPPITPSDGLKEFLITMGYEIVDKRDKGGALWLIGGQELSPFISKLQKEHIPFNYAYNGSKASNKRPAWYTTHQN